LPTEMRYECKEPKCGEVRVVVDGQGAVTCGPGAGVKTDKGGPAHTLRSPFPLLRAGWYVVMEAILSSQWPILKANF